MRGARTTVGCSPQCRPAERKLRSHLNNVYETNLLDRPAPIRTRIDEEYVGLRLGTSRLQAILDSRKENNERNQRKQ
jgi:hypothetical protein